MRTMEQQMASTRAGHREQGRQARRDGLTIADCPAFPSIPPRPIGHVEHGAEWIEGWREQDALETCSCPNLAGWKQEDEPTSDCPRCGKRWRP